MSKSIADLIADLRREQAEDAEQIARNRRAQIARELQEAQNRLSGV
jgi:hypothetical protein